MRADLYLTQNGYASSRTLAQKLITDGAVTLDGRTLKKPSEDIPEGVHEVAVAAVAETRYVGRGGLKLEAALAAFPVDVRGIVAADIGASTGGFTDCLLQNGAARVYAVDAGHDQLHPRLLADLRVRSAEGMNARSLMPRDLMKIETDWQAAHPEQVCEPFDGLVEGIVMDVSFISQTLLHPALAGILREGGWMIALVKPQFELTKNALNKQGIVKQEKDRKAALDKVLASASACGFEAVSVIPSPIEGGDGNREFLAYFRKRA
jgi:23S rRNA (cytidine1920-2'-O)/16S rRNA (cytidine1409-2'-O)-methyltransferase